MAYSSKRTRKVHAPEDLIREHACGSGFAWSLVFPERQRSALGERKPLAQALCYGYEPYYLPVTVARKLEKSLEKGEMSEPESHAELVYLLGELCQKCAMQRVVDMVSRREYSHKEAQMRLVMDGYTKACAEKVLSRACELKIINDHRFTESFIRSKVYAGWGPVRIEQELSRRGVDTSNVEGWPEAYYEDESFAQSAYKLIEFKTIPSKNPYQKLVRFLVSRGYSLAVAKEAVSMRLQGYEDFSN